MPPGEPSFCGGDAAFLSNYSDHLFLFVAIYWAMLIGVSLAGMFGDAEADPKAWFGQMVGSTGEEYGERLGPSPEK